MTEFLTQNNKKDEKMTWKGSSMRKEKARVISQRELADGIYDLRISTELSCEAKPGQFINVYTNDKAKLMPRPISICQIDRMNAQIRLVYRVSGDNTGTKEFSGYENGDEVGILGVLGNGFPVEEGRKKNCLVFGGGIGIPPLLELCKDLHDHGALSVTAILGYRSEPLFLADEFKPYAKVVIATEDGSYGTKGNVIDAAKTEKLNGDLIYSCGPIPMLRGVKNFAKDIGAKAYISLEERMACGVGACLGCVCKTVNKDEHSNVNNARVCTEGPVFDAEDVEI